MSRSLFTGVLKLVLLFATCCLVKAQNSDVPKFEIGPQFTVLNVNQPAPVFGCCVIVPDVLQNSFWKTGIGVRMTYNFNKHIAADGAVNFFPDSHTDSIFPRARPEGKIYQGQFGVKAGKRFEKVGVFAKARPGFTGFTEVNELVNPADPFQFDSFKPRRETYFSLDVGGVVEFYPSRNTVVRIDAGDTIIRYGTFRVAGFVLTQPVVERPPLTKHNFQLVTGFGFRF